MVVSVDDHPELPDRISAHRARGGHDLARYLRCDNYGSLTTAVQYYPIAEYLKRVFALWLSVLPVSLPNYDTPSH